MKKLNLIISGLLGLALYACGENDAFCTRDLQLFRESIRTESVSGKKRAAYILFSPDSLYADLYESDNKPKERLQRRTLPDGRHI